MSQTATAAVTHPRAEPAANAHDPRLLVADNAPNILVQLMELAGQRGIAAGGRRIDRYRLLGRKSREVMRSAGLRPGA